jgi:prevent-host-death family protein
MSKVWPVQDAKAKFAEIVRRATSEGPQILTHRGVETAAVVSMDDLRRIQDIQVPVKDILLQGPILDDDIVDAINERSRDTGRDIDLDIDL